MWEKKRLLIWGTTYPDHDDQRRVTIVRVGLRPILDRTSLRNAIFNDRANREFTVDPLSLDGPDNPSRTRRLDWAKLLKRVFAVDVLTCPKCEGPMRLIGIVEDERIARRILTHLGLPSRAPPRSRASPSLQRELPAPEQEAIDPPLVLD
jgi:hypothetical protein